MTIVISNNHLTSPDLPPFNIDLSTLGQEGVLRMGGEKGVNYRYRVCVCEWDREVVRFERYPRA